MNLSQFLNIDFKAGLHKHCINLLRQKDATLRDELAELTASLQDDTKSSAGDKHETSRAMNQLEQEKINKRIADNIDLLQALQSLRYFPPR